MEEGGSDSFLSPLSFIVIIISYPFSSKSKKIQGKTHIFSMTYIYGENSHNCNSEQPYFKVRGGGGAVITKLLYYIYMVRIYILYYYICTILNYIEVHPKCAPNKPTSLLYYRQINLICM